MSIAPVQAPLCRALTEDPEALASSHEFKGTLYRVAAIICGIAFVAIFAAASAVYLGLMAMPPAWAIAAGMLSSVGFMQGGTALWAEGCQQLSQAEQQQQIAYKLNDIQESNVADLFQQIGIAMPADVDPMALRPLIARFQVLEKERESTFQSVNENNEGANFHFQRRNNELEYKHSFYMLKNLEDLAFIKLRIAIILQNLQFPTNNYSFEQTKIGQTLCVNNEVKGIISLKTPDIRTLDFVAIRPRIFFESIHPQNPLAPVTIEQCNQLDNDSFGASTIKGPPLTLEKFYIESPEDLRAMIFDAPVAEVPAEEPGSEILEQTEQRVLLAAGDLDGSIAMDQNV